MSGSTQVLNRKQRFIKWVQATIFSPALVGVVVGSVTTIYATNYTAQKQRRTEMRQRSYFRLLGLRSSYGEAVEGQLQLGIEGALLQAKIRLGDKSEHLRDSADKTVEHERTYVARAADVRKEVFEALGEASVAFDDDDRVQALARQMTGPVPIVDRSKIDSLQSMDAISAVIAQFRDDIVSLVAKNIDEPMTKLTAEIALQLKKDR